MAPLTHDIVDFASLSSFTRTVK